MIFKKIKIIAEIGVNHNGSLKIAKKLINEAKNCNADFVKFQFFFSKNLVKAGTELVDYQKNFSNKSQSQLALLKKLELKKKQIIFLKKYTESRNLKFLCTPFGSEEALFLNKIGIKIFKISSGEINNYPLLDLISKIATEVFLSTGMATLKEIQYAIKILTKRRINKNKITILHCTSEYPTDDKNVNIRSLKKIKDKLNIEVGYSDHTIGENASLLAVANGAIIIEKHITLSNKMNGPDHKASMEIKKFKKFVENIKKVPAMLGKYEKKPTKKELINKKLIRKSIVAKKKIKKGDIFSENNITTKRPEGGKSPTKWTKIIGTKSKRDYRPDQFI